MKGTHILNMTAAERAAWGDAELARRIQDLTVAKAGEDLENARKLARVRRKWIGATPAQSQALVTEAARRKRRAAARAAA